MVTYVLIAFIPFVISWVARMIFPHTITWLEMGISILAGVAITAIVYFTGIASQVVDYEVWNGQVTAKRSEHVPCSHSYECNCRTVYSGTGKDRRSSRECDTCYEHAYDVDWNVYTNVGNLTISRVDRRGTTEPPRWTAVKIGEPASIDHMFVNYIKAVPDTLNISTFNPTLSSKVPSYPGNVYDYYRYNPVVTIGVNLPDRKQWQADMNTMMMELGPKRQANVIPVFVNSHDQNMIHAIESKWVGGKKNDIIVAIGTTSYPKIDWVAVSSWSKSEQFKVELRDAILAMGSIDRPAIVQAIREHTMKSFKRRPMADFEYLKYEVEPPTWALILAVFLSIVTAVGTSIWFHRIDIQSSNTFRSYRRF